MRIRNRRRLAAERADALHRAMASHDPTTPVSLEIQELMDVAQMLRPAQSQSEAHRLAVRERLLRGIGTAERREDAGSRDGFEPDPVSVQELGDPTVGSIRMADIEPITPERMIEVSERLADILERHDRVSRER